MKNLWLFALPFASLCPFYAFGFPSVSPFWGASNPDWLNELRSDYPLNSTCVEWSYFHPRPRMSAICALLPSSGSASLNRWSRRSSVLSGVRCASFRAFVQTLGPFVAYSCANWRTTLIVRSELFVEQDTCSATRRTWVSCPLQPLSFQPSCVSPGGRQIPGYAWRPCARRCGPIPEAMCRTCGQPTSLERGSACTQL